MIKESRDMDDQAISRAGVHPHELACSPAYRIRFAGAGRPVGYQQPGCPVRPFEPIQAVADQAWLNIRSKYEIVATLPPPLIWQLDNVILFFSWLWALIPHEWAGKTLVCIGHRCPPCVNSIPAVLIRWGAY